MGTKNLEISALLDLYGGLLTDKQRQLTSHYYDEDLSLAEIAENEGITRQGVRDIIKRAEAQLTECEQQLHFHRQSEEIAEKIAAVRRLAQQIADGSSDDTARKTAQEILRYAEEI